MSLTGIVTCYGKTKSLSGVDDTPYIYYIDIEQTGIALDVVSTQLHTLLIVTLEIQVEQGDKRLVIIVCQKSFPTRLAYQQRCQFGITSQLIDSTGLGAGDIKVALANKRSLKRHYSYQIAIDQ